MLHIVLLGPPGSGKGTQAERLVQKYHFVPIAVGALLREQITNNAPYKEVIERYINHGQLVPDSLSLTFVEQLVRQYCSTRALLFDGFPRTMHQVALLNDLLKQYQIQIDAVIFLEVDRATLLQRIQSRAMIEGRSDDQDESKIKTRMHIYEQETLPIVNHYQAQQKLYRIDGKQTVVQVEQEIDKVIAQFTGA